MDQRLSYLAGTHRLHRLTRNEVPDLAKAIVAFMRGQASCGQGIFRDTPFVWIRGEADVDVIVRQDDWVKITPYLKDGSFDTTLVPVSREVVQKPLKRFDGSITQQGDRILYERILAVLNGLFTVEFPSEGSDV